jgi:hypothetical protein
MKVWVDELTRPSFHPLALAVVTHVLLLVGEQPIALLSAVHQSKWTSFLWVGW